MSAAPALIELAVFDGAVQCRLQAGAVNLILSGRERGGGALEALMAGTRTDAAQEGAAQGTGASDGAALGSLPSSLHDARLLERTGVHAAAGLADPRPSGARAVVRRLRLQSRERQLDLTAYSLQLHRDAAPSFHAAVPPLPATYGRRFGWALLLWLLRVPGVAPLLTLLRGGR